MPLLIAAAILVVYIVLGVLYESYIHPLTILSALPSARRSTRSRQSPSGCTSRQR